jgi:ubiquinone/menaquinone biosynthesis C-methylase UbiE
MKNKKQDKKTIEVYEKCADNFAEKFMNLKLYIDSIKKFSNILKNNSKILDIGCGPGNVTKYLLKKNSSFNIIGIDYSKAMIKIAKKNVPKATFMYKDARNINLTQNNFDAIIAAFVIPYFNSKELSKFIKNTSKLLFNKGLFYLSCMEGKKSGYEKTSFSKGLELYVNYHTREEIEKKILKNNFKIIYFKEQPYQETDGSITIDLIFIAKKNKKK